MRGTVSHRASPAVAQRARAGDAADVRHEPLDQQGRAYILLTIYCILYTMCYVLYIIYYLPLMYNICYMIYDILFLCLHWEAAFQEV